MNFFKPRPRKTVNGPCSLAWLIRGRRLEIVKPRAFSESELNIALAAAADEHPLWRAIHQLIDVAEENANENAAANVDPPTVLAGYVGGAGHLRMLREELFSRRELGMEQMQKKG